jgi:hypothetical protein
MGHQVKCTKKGRAPKGARKIRVGKTRKEICWKGSR